MDKNTISDSISTSKINPTTLDYLYNEQLTELRQLILNNVNQNHIGVCEKWIQIFNQSKKKKNWLETVYVH